VIKSIIVTLLFEKVANWKIAETIFAMIYVNIFTENIALAGTFLLDE
jgi:hypothetical protein